MAKSITWSRVGASWAALALFGCDPGEPGQTRSTENVAVATYELRSEIPKCSPIHLDHVYFVKSENQFFVCDGRKLEPIDLHGEPGKDGVSTLVTTTDAPVDQCPNGGVLILIGPDKNHNRVLDAPEIESTASVCNGAPGAQGPQGPEGPRGDQGAPGKDGESCNLVDNGDGTGTITCPNGQSLKVVLAQSVNHGPTANPDSYTVAEDTVLDIPAPGVLANDTDPDGDALLPILDTGPANGALTLRRNGSLTYTPAVDFSGTDSFTYRVSDGSSISAPTTVTITVTPVNDPPTAGDDSYSVDEDAILTVQAPGVLANDADPNGDSLTIILVSTPTHGGLPFFNPDGSFGYIPDVNFSGTDSFQYAVTDGSLTSAPATVTITVNRVDDPPVAVDDNFTITEDTILTVQIPGILENDNDPNGDTLSCTFLTNPAHGRLPFFNGDGSFGYIPDPDFTGTDSFTYAASDGSLTSNTATITITVVPAQP
jgi:VCBS repeat-containing protein